MAVDAPFADWLRSPALVAVDSAVSAWGVLAIDSSITSPLAIKADAEAEAQRQRTFLGPPAVVDVLRVPGRCVDLVGQAVTLIADHEGYRADAVVFVVSAQEQEGDNSTIVRVIRRLA